MPRPYTVRRLPGEPRDEYTGRTIDPRTCYAVVGPDGMVDWTRDRDAARHLARRYSRGDWTPAAPTLTAPRFEAVIWAARYGARDEYVGSDAVDVLYAETKGWLDTLIARRIDPDNDAASVTVVDRAPRSTWCPDEAAERERRAVDWEARLGPDAVDLPF
jgi:hypothetical protein